MNFIAIFWTFLCSFSLTTSTYEIIKQEIVETQNLNSIKKLNNEEELDYQSLITPSVDYMYYGRILKYYYANSIIVGAQDLEILEKNITVSGNNSQIIKELFVQNLLASTIMPSIYGTSSDSEFFAESFSKWLNTDDNLKNKSWEITNNFFINIFPEIIKIGGMFDDNYNNEQTIANHVVELVQADKNSPDKVLYDTRIAQNSNELNLQYNSPAIIWYNSYPLNLIQQQIRDDYGVAVTYRPIILETAAGWMNNSYTKASSESIAEFNDFNKNYYESFSNLDSKLSSNSKDKNNFSTVWFSYVFNNLEEVYLQSTPSNTGVDYEKWTAEHTKQLQQLTLDLYNALYALIQNETWVNLILSGFIVSPDYPLVGNSDMNGVMGYTNSNYYVNNQTNEVVSFAYSYMVLTGTSLTYKKFNDQYRSGFWSSPNKFNVLIHEMGHVVDGFGSKINSQRNTNFAKDLDYRQLYSGNVFGQYEASTSISFTTVFLVVGGIVIGVTVTYYIVQAIRKKQKPKK